MNNYAAYVREVAERVSSTTIATPEQRIAFKKGYSFSGLSYQEQLQIWDHIWRTSQGFLSKVQAFLFLEQQVRRREIPPTLWDTIQHWQEQVDGWGLCDCLAKIYTKILEIAPLKVYSRLREWNRSDNPWKRRQSIVSLLYFSGTKKVYLPFNKIKMLIMPLLDDPEYYVQKGVGWTLREMYSVYPGETLPLLEKHIHQISSIAFTIAIEKMDKQQKDKLKMIRKKKA